jgi:hypothetical protein
MIDSCHDFLFGEFFLFALSSVANVNLSKLFFFPLKLRSVLCVGVSCTCFHDVDSL